MAKSCEKYPLEACFPLPANQGLNLSEGSSVCENKHVEWPLLASNLRQPICSPALTLPMVLLYACEFQVLKYYNHLLQFSVKHFLQLRYTNPTSCYHKSIL